MGDVSCFFFFPVHDIWSLSLPYILGIATIHEPGNPPKPTKKYGISTTLVWLNYQQSSASIGIWTKLVDYKVILTTYLCSECHDAESALYNVARMMG